MGDMRLCRIHKTEFGKATRESSLKEICVLHGALLTKRCECVTEKPLRGAGTALGQFHPCLIDKDSRLFGLTLHPGNLFLNTGLIEALEGDLQKKAANGCGVDGAADGASAGKNSLVELSKMHLGGGQNLIAGGVVGVERDRSSRGIEGESGLSGFILQASQIEKKLRTGWIAFYRFTSDSQGSGKIACHQVVVMRFDEKSIVGIGQITELMGAGEMGRGFCGFAYAELQEAKFLFRQRKTVVNVGGPLQ